MSANVNNFFENLVNGSNPKYMGTSSWTPSPTPAPVYSSPAPAPSPFSPCEFKPYVPMTFPTINYGSIGEVNRFST